MSAKLWAVLTELENALPLSQVTLHVASHHYRFTVFRPDEGRGRFMAFDRPEFDALTLHQILDSMVKQEILGALALALIAVEMTDRQGAIHVTTNRRKAA